jgi:hypothetical protein
MPEQLLNGHDVGTRPQQPRRKGMTQRVPRYSFESGLFTGQLEAGLQIPETITGYLVVEHIRTLPHGLPRFENTIRRVVQRYDEHPASFLDECFQPPFKIHLLPMQVENIARPEPGIKREDNHVLKVGRAAGEQSLFFFLTQCLKLKIVFCKKLHQTNRVRPLAKIPALREIEHMLEKRQFAIDGWTDLPDTMLLEILDSRRSDGIQIDLPEKSA